MSSLIVHRSWEIAEQIMNVLLERNFYLKGTRLLLLFLKGTRLSTEHGTPQQQNAGNNDNNSNNNMNNNNNIISIIIT